MKTPEEIKESLARCPGNPGCDRCMMASTCAIEEDALAYIQQLEAQVPKWISVEERLPEEMEDVLVCTYGALHVAHVICFDMIDGSAMWSFTGMGADPEYWMPLPEPPKEVQHAETD